MDSEPYENSEGLDIDDVGEYTMTVSPRLTALMIWKMICSMMHLR